MSISRQEMEKLSKEMAISLLEINFLLRLKQVFRKGHTIMCLEGV